MMPNHRSSQGRHIHNGAKSDEIDLIETNKQTFVKRQENTNLVQERLG